MSTLRKNGLALVALVVGLVGGSFGTHFLSTGEVIAAGDKTQPQMDKVLAKVGDTTIYVRDLEDKVLEIPGIMRQNFEKVDGKEKLLENMIKGELLYLAAKKAGYDTEPEIQEKVEETVKSIYQSEYFKREIQNAVVKNEQQAREYYEKNKEAYAIPETRKVRHILVSDRSAALDAKKKLDGGAKWAAVVEEYSQDTMSKGAGGLLGFLKNDGMVLGSREPNITNAAFNAAKGEVAGPVKSGRGWHLLLVEEINEKSYQPFSNVKAEIADLFLVTDDMIRQAYEAEKDEHRTRERIKVSHIKVGTKSEADKILAELKGGKDWATLARLHSEDTATATKGGEMGYIYRDAVIKGIGKDANFENAVFAMKGQTDARVVQSKAGFHVVKVADYEPARQKTYAEMVPVLRNQLLRQAREDLLENQFDKMKAEFGVKVNDDLIVDTTWRLKDVNVQSGGQTTGAPSGGFPGFPGQ